VGFRLFLQPPLEPKLEHEGKRRKRTEKEGRWGKCLGETLPQYCTGRGKGERRRQSKTLICDFIQSHQPSFAGPDPHDERAPEKGEWNILNGSPRTISFLSRVREKEEKEEDRGI